MTATSVGAHALPDRAGRGVLEPTARVVGAALAVVLGVLAVLHAATIRGLEASASGWITHRTTGLEVFVAPERATFYWGIGSPETFGLRVTPECSSAYVVGPLLCLFGGLLLLRRLSTRRVLVGLAAGLGVVVLTNLFRVGLIALAVDTWGRGAAFWWSHVVVGSLIAIVGNIAGIALAISVAFGHRRRSWWPRRQRA